MLSMHPSRDSRRLHRPGRFTAMLAVLVMIIMVCASASGEMTILTASRGRYRAVFTSSEGYSKSNVYADHAVGSGTVGYVYKDEIYNVVASYGYESSLTSSGYYYQWHHIVDGSLDGWVPASRLQYIGPLNSSITFSNVSNPTNLRKGQGYYMSGTITSEYPIVSVQGYFINASTGAAASTPSAKTVNLNNTTVDIRSQVDPVLYFASLPVGSWKLVLIATDSTGASKSHTTNAFSVTSGDSSIVFSNVSNPPNQVKGAGFYTSGTITSNYPIVRVDAYFIDAYSGAQASSPSAKTVTLNTTSVDIRSQVDNVLYFAQLKAGTWKLVFKATDSNGASATHTTNAFTVTDTTDDCNYWNCTTDAAGWYRCGKEGLNINSGHNWNSYITEMPPYTLCYVTKGSTKANYYHVVWNGYEGISSKNYLTRVASYTLTFDDQGGSGGPGSVLVWDQVGDYSSITPPFRNDYTFTGYFRADGYQVYNAAGSCINEGAYWSNNTYVRGQGETLYAHWTPNRIYAQSVSLDQQSLNMTLGDEIQLTASVSPDNTTDKTVNWFSDDTQVAIVTNGKVSAVGPGNTTVRAVTADGSERMAAVAVRVSPIYASSITLNCANTVLIAGDTAEVVASVLPENATDKRLVWFSSAPAVATVENGIVKGCSAGTAVIKAQSTDGHAESSIIFTIAPPVDTFYLCQNSVNMVPQGVGMRYPLRYVIEPEDSADCVVWSSSAPEVAVVNAEGVVTAVSEGRAIITAGVPYGPSETCVIQVRSDLSLLRLPDSLTTIADEAFLGVPADRVIVPDTCEHIGSRVFAGSGARYILLPQSVTDIAADAFDGAEQICVICAENSEPQRFAMAHGLRYVIDNESTLVRVKALSLPPTLTMEIMDTSQLAARVSPAAANPMLAWASGDESIAVVSSTGVVTAISPGTTSITATALDGTMLSASCQLTVTLPQVTVTATPTDDQAIEGTRAELSATVSLTGASTADVGQLGIVLYDADDQRIGQRLAAPDGSEGPLLCACDTQRDMGLTLAPKTAYRYRCAVVVKGVAFLSEPIGFTTREMPPQIVLSDTELTLIEGETATLTATVLYAEDQEILWSTDNTSIASVLEGTIRAGAQGSATIKVRLLSNPLICATCTVTVVPAKTQPGPTLALSPSSVQLARSETIKLEAVATPTSSFSLQWRSSAQDVAMVDGNGTVTALKAGRADIFVEDVALGVSARCQVTVLPRLVERVVLSAESIELTVGSRDVLTAEALPASADERGVCWSSSDEGVVTVDGGTLSAVSAGSATVTATALDAGAASADCLVTVRLPQSTVDTSPEKVNPAKLKAVLDRANAWADCVWTAPVDIPVYNNNYGDPAEEAYQTYYWYPAGTEMHGIPYTLSWYCKYRPDIYLPLSDAAKGEDNYFTYQGWQMWGPKYGGDCTCLVNDALWAGDDSIPHDGQVPLKKMGWLFAAADYADLAPGDVLALPSHVAIVVAVDGDDVTVVESRGNGDTVGAIHCPNLTPRAGGGFYVCGVCACCNGENKCGSIRHRLTKAALRARGYTVHRYIPLYR